jgi:hypothetical protein
MVEGFRGDLSLLYALLYSILSGVSAGLVEPIEHHHVGAARELRDRRRSALPSLVATQRVHHMAFHVQLLESLLDRLCQRDTQRERVRERSCVAAAGSTPKHSRISCLGTPRKLISPCGEPSISRGGGKPRAYSDAKANRNVRDFGVGRSLTRPFRDAHRFPSTTIVACTHLYTHAAKVWDLSIVQRPFSVDPSQTLALRFATFASL